MEARRKARRSWLTNKDLFCRGEILKDLFLSGIGSLMDLHFPSVNKEAPRTVEFEQVLCRYPLRLPGSLVGQIKNVVKNLYAMSRDPLYQNKIQGEDPELFHHRPKNQSVLMSYDFHIQGYAKAGGVELESPDADLSPNRESPLVKLIEVNTNASGFMFAALLYLQMAEKSGAAKNALLGEVALDSLRSSFESEWGNEKRTPFVAIIDEKLNEQKMLPEFYMFRDFFLSMGWQSEICDYQSLKIDSNTIVTASGKKIDFIYNRLNDFYFSRLESRHLRDAFLNHYAVFSPNPFEFQLLADKRRLIEWSQSDFCANVGSEIFQPDLAAHLLGAQILTDDNAVENWERRKSLFFKPLGLYGGKLSYRGASISRKLFESLMLSPTPIIAQEYCPAPERDINGQTWKYDIRAYAYRDQVQMIVGRTYQGQLTNFTTKGGGFTAIQWQPSHSHAGVGISD